MFSAASERPRHTFAAALRGAGLLEKDREKNKDKDARMADASGSTKRSSKVRSHKARNTDNVKDPGTSSRASLLAAKARGTSLPVSIRGAAKLGITTKLSRRPPHDPLSSSSVPSETISVWKDFVQKRWNPQAQFLNLEYIRKDEVLRPVRRESSPLTTKEISVLFKLASQLQPEVQSLSLANNELTSTNTIHSLHHYLPGVRNLSLANNKIWLWKELDYISARKGKCLHLKELVLNGNPMREHEMTSAKMERYKSEVLRRFPTLELLDSEVVTKITFDTSESSTLPPPPTGQGPTSFPVQMNGGLIAPGMEGFVADFLTKFFTLYDTARSSLAEVYGPNATFSFAANTSIPPRARIQGYHYSTAMPNQKKLEWSQWLTGSRNLSRLHNAQRAEQSLHTGTEDVIRKVLSLPGTKHDIAAVEKFVVDAWPVQGVLPAPADASTVLLITVHGQFEEEPSHGIRSFDRTFILAPSPEGSRAQMAGWAVLILSDQLVVRAYSSHEAWTPGAIRMPPQEAPSTSTPTPVPPPAPQAAPGFQPLMGPGILLQPEQQLRVAIDPVLGALPEAQRVYVIELSARTGLTATYSIQCLEGNGWDPQQAMANFEAVRAQLPSEAFAS
ncbi:hypothetical protein BU17DRAFT_78428 [Hysterangium stoloniferum]|nr:hypothetical protein BU17DRAFT_78428 [Hysterangium stoloniferum]